MLVVLAWSAALGGALAVAPGLRSAAITDPFEFFPDDAPSRRSAAALAELFPETRAASQVAIVLEWSGRAAEERRAWVAGLASALRSALPETLATAVLAPSDGPLLAERLASADGSAALVVVRLAPGFASEQANAAVARIEALLDRARDDPRAPLRAFLSGDATLGRDYLDAVEEGGRRTALATVLLVAAVLLLVYRAPVAALVSLATLSVALGVSLGLVTLCAKWGLPVAYQARSFLVALVYGVGTDYGLLLFARAREEASAGAGDADAVARARRRTAPVLLTSAAVVVLACALMGFARFGLFRYAGPALALGVAVAAAAVLSLAPALMRLTGRALFWPRDPRRGSAPARLWPAVARLSVGHPVPVLVAFAAPLAPLAFLGLEIAPSFELELDVPRGSPSESGRDALLRYFDAAAVAPLALVVDRRDGGGDFRSLAGLDSVHRLTQMLADADGVTRVWSATRPTGEPGLLAPATLWSQLGVLAAGLEGAGKGAGELAEGLDAARREIGIAEGRLAARERKLEGEQRRSLVAAFAPERLEAARRDLRELAAGLAALEAGLGEGEDGARALARDLAEGAGRLRSLLQAPEGRALLDHVALTPEDVRATPELARALDHYLATAGRAALFELELEAPPNSPAAVATARDLRERLPAALAALGIPGTRVWQAGPTAITADLAALTRADRLRLDRWILAGVFLLLVALLRGVAAPGAIAAYILVSYFAALGALELAVRAGLWPGLDWKVPFFLFVLLVAIGADYGVFVLGRAREERGTRPFPRAVARAVEATGPVVTSCGLVLAGTFATLALSRIVFLEQVGLGIAVGVLIDTLVVRPFLLPATAVLLAQEHAPRP